MSRMLPTEDKLSYHPLYWVYRAMIARCHNSKAKRYKDYGGRGILVCEDWRISFLVFYKWALANGWQKGLQLDRENNEEGYCPLNCRFITAKKNSDNRRTSIKVEINGEVDNFKNWCERLCVNYKMATSRVRILGWTYLEALEINKRK